MTVDAKWIKDALAKHPCSALAGGMLRSCPVRLSFPELFVAKAGTDDAGNPTTPKFGVTLLFPKGADISVLRAAVKTAQDGKFGTAYKGAKLHVPFRDQEDKAHFEGYEPGAFFFSASTMQKPQVVDVGGNKITDEERVYPGVWAIVSLRPYAFDTPKKKGVSLGLGNVMIIRDDDRLGGGRTEAADDFAGVDASGDAAAMFE